MHSQQSLGKGGRSDFASIIIRLSLKFLAKAETPSVFLQQFENIILRREHPSAPLVNNEVEQNSMEGALDVAVASCIGEWSLRTRSTTRIPVAAND